ncbi:hypothetical protein [Novosphingobium sp. MMS21-SN21R]|uniref:hypothetical protein n=1 Tax=Novosphingobium sp. MMS21-SN21R TaxID=2969298 RepID=UPI00288770B2|nr:hypothetical protein [Novosphingobium sp. MMS21-SN21R]MDT0507549.1 hypothetical protein [Novosphingobium sp. MMS21-SN21R]MDT0509516.1 hypothetical protein [Novosphingobium sp. MMS21-SN21R]
MTNPMDLAKTLEGLLSAYRKPDSTTADAFALRSHMVAHADEIVAALHRTGQLIVAQAGDVEADAARYRWLRDHSCPPHNFYISVPDEFHGVRYAPSEVDAYIDAARQALGDEA